MNAAAVAHTLTFVCIKDVLLKVGWVRVGGGKEKKESKAKHTYAPASPEIISIAVRTGF